VDRFNHWMSVDPVTGDVNVSFYDTRNDTTGFRYMTDIYFSQSRTGAASWLQNVRVTDASSNEHDCDGVFPCAAIDYGNQQGDYAGIVSLGGVSHPIWTDSRNQLLTLPGCGHAEAVNRHDGPPATAARYSERRVTDGSTRAARHAGSQHAIADTPSSNATTPT
jgi:hypothetical protein